MSSEYEERALGDIIVDDYEGQFKRLVAKYVAKGHQVADAEDIAQEAVMKSLEASAEDKARSYLDQAANSVVVDKWRRMDGVEEVELEEWLEPYSETLEDQLVDEEEQDEVKGQLYELINTVLSPMNRDIMQLYTEERGIGEIAEAMGLSEGAVKNRIHESTEKMKKEVNKP